MRGREEGEKRKESDKRSILFLHASLMSYSLVSKSTHLEYIIYLVWEEFLMYLFILLLFVLPLMCN